MIPLTKTASGHGSTQFSCLPIWRSAQVPVGPAASSELPPNFGVVNNFQEGMSQQQLNYMAHGMSQN